MLVPEKRSFLFTGSSILLVMTEKEIELHAGQHLYCDFDQSGLGDTCLFCGGDVRFVTYAPCPKGFAGKLLVQEGRHLILPGEDKCLACGKKDGACPLDPEMIYCQY